MHRIPAGFPFGMPGMGEEMDGAMQHAPQCILHFILVILNLAAWSS